MRYDDIAAAFLIPPAEPLPVPTLPTTPARRLRDAVEPIATQGWWSRPAAERVIALGLGFFDGYVWGRAAALGTPPPEVVVATFGVFDHDLLTAVYVHGSTTASREDVLAARTAGAAESLDSIVSADEADAVSRPLLDALAALDAVGRPLFAALRALPLPATAGGRLWRAAELVREHRGDSHLAALVAAGVDGPSSNVLTELWLGFGLGEYSSSRGFSPGRIEELRAGLEARGWVDGHALTEEGRAAREAIEAATDLAQQELVDRLGTALEHVIVLADSISARLLHEQRFPHDPRKRAAG
jgi:hypothetical protein